MNTDNLIQGWPPKLAKFFQNAITTNPRSAFVDTILKPMLVEPVSYLPTGRGSIRLDKNETYSLSLHQTQDWQSAGHFCNPLAYPSPGLRPLDRVVLPDAGHIVFTLECDPSSIDDADIGLACQVEWVRVSKSKNGSAKRVPILDLFEALSAFPNFAGIVANWSGNKSVHIHVAMSTDDLLNAAPPSAGIREGLIQHWNKLNAIAHPIFFPGRPMDDPVFKFDRTLRLPEQFRRVPAGTRYDRSATVVVGPQPVLFERLRGRAANGSARSFWQPELFVAPAPARKVVRSSKSPRSITNTTTLTDRQHEHVLSELAAHFAGHLIPVDLVHDARDGWKAIFQNHEGDKNASTIIRGDYRKAFICGHHPDEDAVPLLPLDLASCIEMWIAELDGAPSYEPTGKPLVDRFAERVTTRGDAGSAMLEFLKDAIPAGQRMIVKAPEGVGKSTSLFKLHSTIVREGDASMYAFASYAEAEAKCASFNAMQGEGSPFTGIVLHSFSEAYRRAGEAVGGLAPLTTAQIAASGAHRSRIEAIETMQPDVMQIVEQGYRDLWANVPDGRTAVLFTVHQVAHGWGDGSLSRSLASPGYWDLPKAERNGWRDTGLDLSLMVHDEVSTDTFIEHRPAHVVEWVHRLREKDRAIWKTASASIRERFESFSSSTQNDLTFDECVRLMSYPEGAWDRSFALDRGEYHDLGARGIYAASGAEWRVASRHWWQNAADRVVWLTTENVPCVVARKADSEIVVYDLRTPLLPAAAGGTVDVHPAMSVVAGRFGEIVEGRCGEGWIAISNKLKDAGVASHKLAKGSNGYIGANVVQTMGLMGAEQYRALLALGDWCDRDLVIATHVDELFQSVGRNMGFRWDGLARHELYVNRRLWDFIRESGALTGGRYSFEVNADLQMRHDAK